MVKKGIFKLSSSHSHSTLGCLYLVPQIVSKMRHIHISLPINIFKTSAVRLLVEHLGILEQNQNKIAVF